MHVTPTSDQLNAWRKQLDCSFAQIDGVFEECMSEAYRLLTDEGMHTYVESAKFLGKMGRGVEPALVFLQNWPQAANSVGENSLVFIMNAVRTMTRSPNGNAIAFLLQSLAAVARRLPASLQMQDYLDLSLDLMERTSVSIHGIHKTYASPGLPDFFKQSPYLLSMLSVDGLRKWVEYGVRNYAHHPERQREYFSLQSADSRAVMQRERHGTLFVDHARQLDLYLLGLWHGSDILIPYSTSTAELATPYFDALGIRLPDVYDDLAGIQGINRYRAALAHMAAHKHWTTPLFADNYSPFQRLAIELFEDARVEALAMRIYPGLRSIFLALHPSPVEGACDPAIYSCLRHRLAMLSRALLDAAHGYADVALRTHVQRFHAIMAQGESSTEEISRLALSYVAKTRIQSDQLAHTFFTDTVVDYRDDNRHLWRFYELSDDEEMFENHVTPDCADEIKTLPPRHYPEWDYTSQTYRPDWVSLYEHLHPAGNAADIDALLAKHSVLAKQLKRLIDLLKPHNKIRVRYQEQGSELDLDVALRAVIDFKSGRTPDARINMSHTTNGRSIAVTLLLDLSASLNDQAAGSEQTILQLSQEAVALLAWSIEQLGDPFSIAGFHSNTRHDVRYQHILGFSERWGIDAKARLAALQAGYSTRMGPALRHAAHYLGLQHADKKLLLVLTDGQPSDIDVADPQALLADTRQAVIELSQQGIYSHCISLDPKADAYVQEIFGHHFTVIDRVEKLPERLPKLFMSLTH